MTMLDPTGQIVIHRLSGDPDRVLVRVPLALPSETRMREFTELARTVGADVRAFPEGTFLLVTVPAAASREETAELLDGGLRLIEETQALAEARRSASAPTEQYIQDWWKSRTQSRQGDTAPD